jgi:ribulose-phosphate 3-epimerase
MPLVSPSLLSADFAHLEKDIELINSSAADWFHLDIMDGVFVPNISFGMPLVSTIKKYAHKPLDVHLMIIDPDKYIEEFKRAGADILTVHIETCVHAHRTIQYIKSLGMKAGITLNPHTPVSSIENIISDVDMVLVMSVNPGFGGQSFIPQSIQKIKDVKECIRTSQSKALIQVDGGINPKNAPEIVAAGADVLVAGNTIFGSANPSSVIEQLKNN